MKTFRYITQLALGLGITAAVMTSCNYLDVVPAEQADLADANKDKEATLGFLTSCYAGIPNPMNYTALEGAADESVLPSLWSVNPSTITWDNNSSGSPSDGWPWGSCYRYIGQCLLFERELENAKGVTEAEKADYKAEADFMIAYYHFRVLETYGPCPITDAYIDMQSGNDTYHGRYHFDYVVKWICDKLDEVAKKLPATRTGEEWGRATSVIAKALKARLLVYAASPLWNGSFPYPEWKNKNFETPGYGQELVSHAYDKKKWDTALAACKEAIQAAEAAGHRLMQLSDAQTLINQESIKLPYIPFRDENNALTGAADKEFKERVLLMRYVTATRITQGNKEIIWGLANQGDVIIGSLPHRIIKNNSGGWHSGYSGVSPTLNTVEKFYTENGKLPAKDDQFYPQSEWFQSAGATGNQYRANIIKLNAHREPRFYAWLCFDGGDFGSKMNNGNPLTIQARNGQVHGYNPGLFNRDNNQTGYYFQKFIEPTYTYTSAGSSSQSKPRPLIRMAELYLNLAECYAALGQNEEAFKMLNTIRERAGVRKLTTADLKAMTATEWVHNERFIELYGEGHRYFDARRWMEAPKTMAAGVRLGLNAVSKIDPSMTEFNQPTEINQNFKWSDRMYLLPLFINEVYKNPQMVQAPGY
uniref:RagB/SusD family nutrient uptake outer membrane protein n=1 Tax=Prevotella sp. GTC17260 TaxID=3236796 RepID=A0AB33JKK4_9BACT